MVGTPTGRCEMGVGVSELKMKHVLIKGWGVNPNPPALIIARIRVSVITHLKVHLLMYVHF